MCTIQSGDSLETDIIRRSDNMSCHENIECDYKFIAASVSYCGPKDGRSGRKEALWDTCGSIATRFYARRAYTQNQIYMTYIARCPLHTPHPAWLINDESGDNLMLISEDEYVTAKVMHE